MAKENESLFADLQKDAVVVPTGNDPIDKAELVGVPFLITDVVFHDTGKFGNPFATVNILLQDDSKRSFSTSGAGVYAQLEEYREGANRYPRLIPNGLRASDYIYNKKPVTTYYLT